MVVYIAIVVDGTAQNTPELLLLFSKCYIAQKCGQDFNVCSLMHIFCRHCYTFTCCVGTHFCDCDDKGEKSKRHIRKCNENTRHKERDSQTDGERDMKNQILK